TREPTIRASSMGSWLARCRAAPCYSRPRAEIRRPPPIRAAAPVRRAPREQPPARRRGAPPRGALGPGKCRQRWLEQWRRWDEFRRGLRDHWFERLEWHERHEWLGRFEQHGDRG